jgi:hypothetical protein
MSAPSTEKPASRRVIASLGTGPHKQLLDIARKTIEPYAQRHGYELALHTQPTDLTRPAPWSKIQILRDLVERFDLVVWLDSDLVIVDRRRDIATELAPDSFLGLVEHRFATSRFPNSGVMVMRGGGESAAFLDAAWQLDRYTDHRWWENAAICELLGYGLDPPRPLEPTPWGERTTLISPRWNWIPTSRVRQAAIRHFPGLAVVNRRRLMRAATLEARVRALRP